MWTDNTRNTKIKGGGEDQIEVCKILNGYANIDSNTFCFEIKESK